MGFKTECVDVKLKSGVFVLGEMLTMMWLCVVVCFIVSYVFQRHFQFLKSMRSMKKIVLNYKYVVSFGVILKREKILSNQGVFSLYQLSLTTLLHL